MGEWVVGVCVRERACVDGSGWTGAVDVGRGSGTSVQFRYGEDGNVESRVDCDAAAATPEKGQGQERSE